MAYDYNSLFSPLTEPFSLVGDTADGVTASQLPIGTYLTQAAATAFSAPTGLTGGALDAAIAGGSSGTTAPAATTSSGYTGISWLDAVLGYDPLTGKVDTPTNNVLNGGGGVAVSDLTSWTVTRVVTCVLGIVLIIVGLLALSRGPAVNIVSGAVREAAVG